MTRKISFVTTFNQKGLHDYAQRFINSFSEKVDSRCELLVYAERCNPVIPKKDARIKIYDLERNSLDLVEFKKKWKNVPHANGDISNFGKYAQRPDSKKGFKWNAIRFSHKVYAIFDAVKRHPDIDILIWIDADTFVHSPVSYEWLDQFIPNNVFASYLGREPKWPECGWYSMNLKHPNANEFFTEFKRMYNDADNGIFTLKEWHDSYVFWIVIKWLEQNFGVVNKNISSHLPGGEGHPLINSELGKYFDHLKGDRKRFGQSFSNDIRTHRSESYWQTARPKH